jgi:phosphatidylserine synthase
MAALEPLLCCIRMKVPGLGRNGSEHTRTAKARQYILFLFILALFASLFLYLGYSIAGVVFIQIFGIWSCVDGEIARLTKSTSRLGDFYDIREPYRLCMRGEEQEVSCLEQLFDNSVEVRAIDESKLMPSFAHQRHLSRSVNSAQV